MKDLLRQKLSDDQKVYDCDFVMIRVDKRGSDLFKTNVLNRWDPKFWNPEHQALIDEINNNFKTKPFGKYIEYITYGQVGRRELDKKGTVRYIQTINIIDTGIDYYIKPATIKNGSWNDLERSRLQKYDVLLGNAGMGGLGKVAIFLDEIDVNISQDIDILRIKNINPFYVAAFLKSQYGNLQVWYHSKGVGAPKIPFEEVKSILIPVIPKKEQDIIEKRYLEMDELHKRAILMRRKNQPTHKEEFEKASSILQDILKHTESIIQKKAR